VGSLEFTTREPTFYNSSEWGQRGFCPICGSRIVWRQRDTVRIEDEWATNVDVCSLDNPEDVRPNLHIFVDRQLSWHKIDDDLPRATSDEMEKVAAIWKEERLAAAGLGTTPTGPEGGSK
jgi:hypothetical protein